MTDGVIPMSRALGRGLSCGFGWLWTPQRSGCIFDSHVLEPISSQMLTISVERRWTGIRNALAGSFCASLGSLDVQRTASPMRTFLPRGSLPNLTHPHQLRHATMPSERVCTENLTPFLKLLPCKALSGIASLLNPHRLFDADWHGLGVHVSWHPERGVEIVLAFQAVFDPLRYSMIHSRGESAPKASLQGFALTRLRLVFPLSF
jgi:hypothetical protein